MRRVARSQARPAYATYSRAISSYKIYGTTSLNAGWRWASAIGVGISAATLGTINAPLCREYRSDHSDSQPDLIAKKDPPRNSLKNIKSDEISIERVSNNEHPSKPSSWSLSSWSFQPTMPTIPNMPSIRAPSVDDLMGGWSWPTSLLQFKDQTSALLLELSGGKGSLYDNVVSAPPDLSVNPECNWDAQVRLGEELCLAEKAFLRVRKRRMRQAFADILKIPVEDIDERDIPIIAIAGSGGGMRAMCNTIGGLIALQQNRLLDCVTYTAGISGSCWGLGVLYSGVGGGPNPIAAAEHIRKRIQTPYVDISALDLLTSAPTNEYLLSGLIHKASTPKNSISLTDIYGTLISSRLFVPTDIAKLDSRQLSLHHFRRFVDDGQLPMPIFTAISRHLPESLAQSEKDIAVEKTITVDASRSERLKREESRIEIQARWLWFEFTPYEVGCDELGAWIPSWSLGRVFERGESVGRSREISFTVLSGIFASAFCASLQHYFKEVQPVLRTLPTALYEWIATIITDNEQDFSALHPILPNPLPNYVKGLDGQLRSGSPMGIAESDTLGFMDAGAELNIPYYPFLRRNVDFIISLDASADSQDLWFTRAEELAAKRGLATWPKGAHWPAKVPASPTLLSDSSNMAPNRPTESALANRKLAAAQEGEVSGQQKKQQQSEDHGLPNAPPRSIPTSTSTSTRTTFKPQKEQGASEIANTSTASTPPGAHLWIGSSTSDALLSTDARELDEEKLASHDGIGICYIPLVSNQAVPDFDPMSISTWRFELQAEESEKLIDVARANVEAGEEMMTKVLRAMWLRKKRTREEREQTK